MELELPEEIVFVQILSRFPVKFLTQRRRILTFSRSEDHLIPSFSLPCIDEEDASVQSIHEP